MLKKLTIENLILIQSCSVEFAPGLTIISGETGAGKTALIKALELVLGERADSSAIRQGAEKAVVEAVFEIDDHPLFTTLVEEESLSWDKSEPLFIRREIVHNGKNRSFVNGQLTPLPVIQKLAKSLVDLVGQHSYYLLRSSETYRELVDQFGELQDKIAAFQLPWHEEKELQKKKAELEGLNTRREWDLEKTLLELQELEEAALQPGEETTLYEEYKKLIQAQELGEKGSALQTLLTESPQSALSLTKRCKNLWDELAPKDGVFQESSPMLQEALIHLQEASYCLSSYLHRLEYNPSRIEFLEKRLHTIHQIQRKYGKTDEEIQEVLRGKKAKIQTLENLQQELLHIEERLQMTAQKRQKAADALTTSRTKAAHILQEKVVSMLHSLNMPDAELLIAVTPTSLTETGQDAVCFWLKANKGEAAVPAREKSSGGELSRLLFALKTILAEKNDAPILVFDEIDSNVGGETATIMGKQLSTLGKKRQVLCITHFPQVASQADAHIRVYKKESEGRTVASIDTLTKETKEKELLRMLGGKHLPEDLTIALKKPLSHNDSL